MEACNNQKCKTCGLQDQEYYPNRKTCKKCVIEKSKEVYRATYSPDVQFICCKKCNNIKHVSRYIKSKSGLYKNSCNLCRRLPEIFINDDRYKQLDAWVYKLGIDYQDLEYLKYIFANK